jgi:hypothetical protein
MSRASAVSGASSPALRMRRSRERRRRGGAAVSLQLGASEICEMVALGWLPAPDRGDKGALAQALFGLIERAIRARVTPTRGSEVGKVCFLCQLKPSTIETLIDLGWLRADQRDDLAAIVTAFCRFAGRSLEVACNELAHR